MVGDRSGVGFLRGFMPWGSNRDENQQRSLSIHLNPHNACRPCWGWACTNHCSGKEGVGALWVGGHQLLVPVYMDHFSGFQPFSPRCDFIYLNFHHLFLVLRVFRERPSPLPEKPFSAEVVTDSKNNPKLTKAHRGQAVIRSWV